jgi:small subunit ribosomal protein S4e
MALNTVLKELLGKTTTTKESKFLIHNKQVLVNGKVRFDEKFPVGFLDVVSFPLLKENYRLLINKKSKLFMIKINDEEAKLKLSKVMNKQVLSADTVQLNCSDGKNFLFKANDAALKNISINDTVLYSLADNKIIQVLKLEKGALVYLYKGKHAGRVLPINDFKEGNMIFKTEDELFETKRTYAFVIGKEKPVITLGLKIEVKTK